MTSTTKLFRQRENPIQRPQLTALICFLAALMYFDVLSKEYAGAFFLLGTFFELAAWKAMPGRTSK